MSKVFWIQPEDTQLGKWQKQITDIAGSESFCVLPWIHIATRPNGDMRVCCVANASGADTGEYGVGLVKMEDGKPANFSTDLPTTAFNNDYMKSIRKTMLAGKVPASCKKCYDEEAQGISSKRIWETGTWHYEGVDIPELIRQTDEDGGVPYKLQYLDLRLGHTCNLKCIMCTPHDSSQWVKDHKKVFPLFERSAIRSQMKWDQEEFDNYWHERPEFWEEIFDQISNIKQLYFAGGEPLVIKEHKMFLEEIVRRGYAHKILLRYNSNGTIITDEMIDLWSKFRKVKVSISLDGIDARVEYIRYPLNFKDIEKNLWKLEHTPAHIETNLELAVQILNIKHIPEFIKWRINSGFKKLNQGKNVLGQTLGGGLVNFHLLWIPTWMNLRALPVEDKAEVRKLFSELQDWLWENYTQDEEFWETNPYGWKRWEGMLDWMDSEDQTYLLPDFREFIFRMDMLRGTDFRKTFPELEHLL
jgi:sulfatase maturation enzyme AslB (radical SAM superfamily)